MTKIAWLAAILLLPLPSLAETAEPTPQSGVPVPESVGAKLHHEPNAPDVREREIQRSGAPEVQRAQTKEQVEVDQIYDDVMRRSAPPAGSSPGQ